MVSETTMDSPFHATVFQNPSQTLPKPLDQKTNSHKENMQWIKEALSYLLRAKFGGDLPLTKEIPVKTREELLGIELESLPVLQTQPYEPPTYPKLELQGNKMELLLEDNQKSNPSLENFVEHLVCDPPVLQEQSPMAQSVHLLDFPEKKEEHPLEDDEYSSSPFKNFVEHLVCDPIPKTVTEETPWDTLHKKALRTKRIPVKHNYHKRRFKVRKRRLSEKYIDVVVMSYVKAAASSSRRLLNKKTKRMKRRFDQEKQSTKYKPQLDLTRISKNDGEGCVSGGMDKGNCISWVIMGSKNFGWSHLTTLLSRKYVILELLCGVLGNEEYGGVVQDGKSWVVSVVSWDISAGATSRAARPRIPFGNRKTRVVVYGICSSFNKLQCNGIRSKKSGVMIFQIVCVGEIELLLQRVRILYEQWGGMLKDGDQLGSCAILSYGYAYTPTTLAFVVADSWRVVLVITTVRISEVDCIQQVIDGEETQQMWYSLQESKDNKRALSVGMVFEPWHVIISSGVCSGLSKLDEINWTYGWEEGQDIRPRSQCKVRYVYNFFGTKVKSTSKPNRLLSDKIHLEGLVRAYSGESRDRILKLVQQFHILLVQEIKNMGVEFTEMLVGARWSLLGCLVEENMMQKIKLQISRTIFPRARYKCYFLVKDDYDGIIVIWLEMVFSLNQKIMGLSFITATSYGLKHIEIPLTRAKLEDLCPDLLDLCRTLVEKSLRDAKLNFNDIEEVILVDGSTCILAVQELARRLIGKDPNVTVNYDEVVALGVALQAGVVAEDVSDMVILDVTPFLTGEETLGGVLAERPEFNHYCNIYGSLVGQGFRISEDVDGRGVPILNPIGQLDQDLWLFCARDNIKSLRNFSRLVVLVGGNEQVSSKDINETLKQDLRLHSYLQWDCFIDVEQGYVYSGDCKSTLELKLKFKGMEIMQEEITAMDSLDLKTLKLAKNSLQSKVLWSSILEATWFQVMVASYILRTRCSLEGSIDKYVFGSFGFCLVT